MNKNPELRPVDQVEGVIRVGDLEGQRLHVSFGTEVALQPLIHVLAKLADRKHMERQKLEQEQARAG